MINSSQECIKLEIKGTVKATNIRKRHLNLLGDRRLSIVEKKLIITEIISPHQLKKGQAHPILKEELQLIMEQINLLLRPHIADPKQVPIIIIRHPLTNTHIKLIKAIRLIPKAQAKHLAQRNWAWEERLQPPKSWQVLTTPQQVLEATTTLPRRKENKITAFLREATTINCHLPIKWTNHLSPISMRYLKDQTLSYHRCKVVLTMRLLLIITPRLSVVWAAVLPHSLWTLISMQAAVKWALSVVGEMEAMSWAIITNRLGIDQYERISSSPFVPFLIIKFTT